MLEKKQMTNQTPTPKTLMIHEEFVLDFIHMLNKRAEFAECESQMLSYDFSTAEAGVAILPIHGTLVEGDASIYRKYGYAATGYGEISAAMARMRDDKKVQQIVLDINSPGGTASGVAKAAQSIAKSKKPVTASISGYGASAAYYLASQADEIIAETDAMVGSIGVKSVIYDYSAALANDGIKTYVFASGPLKATGTFGASITEEQETAWQRTVDELAQQFFGVVETARGTRGLSIDAIKTGDVWTGAKSAEVGLVDYVMTMDDWIDARKQKTMELKMEQDAIKAAADAAQKAAIAAETERLAAITAAFPDDPAYALSAYQSGKTAIEAKAEYCDLLKAKLAESQAQTEALKTQRGAPPVESDAKAENKPPADYMSAIKAHQAEKNCTFTEACRFVSANHPELRKAYIWRVQ